MGGHKGYGIALLIESLAGLLSGAHFTWQILAWIVMMPRNRATRRGLHRHRHGGDEPIAQFKQRADALAAEIRNQPKAEGSQRIMLPGDFEAENRKRALVEGILLPADVVASLGDLASDLKFDYAIAFRKWDGQEHRNQKGK